jgi:enamine deaminase RidA (YjgF/YER057c/UK114 family)
MPSNTIQPDGWARPRGYANGMTASGPFLFVAGQVGWDPTNEVPTFPKTLVEQFDLALSNVLAVVKKAGSTPQDVINMTVYVANRDEYVEFVKDIGGVWKKHFGKHYPAMALVQVARLLSDEAKVEIQAVATVKSA